MRPVYQGVKYYGSNGLCAVGNYEETRILLDSFDDTQKFDDKRKRLQSSKPVGMGL